MCYDKDKNLVHDIKKQNIKGQQWHMDPISSINVTYHHMQTKNWKSKQYIINQKYQKEGDHG